MKSHFIKLCGADLGLSGASERIFFHEVEVTSYPLFDHPPYTLALATKMGEVAEEASLDLLHVHYAIPHSVSALLARMMALPKRLPFSHHHSARNRYYAGGQRPKLSADYAVFTIEQSDGVTAISHSICRNGR